MIWIPVLFALACWVGAALSLLWRFGSAIGNELQLVFARDNERLRLQRLAQAERRSQGTAVLPASPPPRQPSELSVAEANENPKLSPVTFATETRNSHALTPRK